MDQQTSNAASPAKLGYRMPAEWEPHHATWLTWPRAEGISFPGQFELVPAVYAELIKHLSQVEEVHINVWHNEMADEVRETLRKLGTTSPNIRFHSFPAYEPWCRDHGPIFIVRNSEGRRERAIVDWEYNAWGGKYASYDLDNAVPQQVAKLRNLPVFSPGIILEGGSIEVNGCGTLLTTEACLLNKNRNAHLTKSEIEHYLADYLGVNQILWLGDGIVGDDTDGHIDDLSRFANPTTIITAVEEDPNDENHDILQENLRRLLAFKTPQGQPFHIVQLPMPGRIECEGQRLPASYANFYIANEIVLVPTYRDKNDACALEILQREFPTRRLIGVDSTALIWGLGSFHCISQQEPR